MEITMKINRTLKVVEQLLEKLGFNLDVSFEEVCSYTATISQYTPAGEDWSFTIWFNGSQENLVDKVHEYLEDYDPKEEFAMWVDAKYHNSVAGIPDIETLYEDCKWKEQAMSELDREICKLVYC